ncbi:twin-arginine translocase subunit TatC [Longirhabdus pacifica]|uniref:twin-arginine translocase subunit TatC n=1 Tax=Longirhabdus pacifica TaxID=2305227 RepID=UPI001008CF0E|nr:twin-arginine translocase subunit TatC [Longirhabdus pacifica]
MENKITMVDHLTELRKRVVWVVLIFILSFVGGFIAAKPLILYLQTVEPASSLTLNVFSPWDGLRMYVSVSMVVALLISLPFTLWQLWLFIKPGLKEGEQKATIMYIPFAFLLCLIGISFAYFIVFPLTFSVATSIASGFGLEEVYGIAQYFSFMFNIIIPVALLFQLPVVVLFLTKIRILNPHLLIKVRKYAYIVLLIISTMVTPPDFITPLIVSIPMFMLYESSVWLARRVYKQQNESA